MGVRLGDSYDKALAESIIGLLNTEATKLLGPWKSMGQLEWETLKWVDWYSTKRLHSAIGYVTPHEAEEMFYATLNPNEKSGLTFKPNALGQTRGDSQFSMALNT